MVQIFLLFIIFVLACFIYLQRVTSAAVRLTVLALLATGAYFVLIPEHANAVARLLGVGRGADLMMYLWVVVSLFMILLLYLKIIELNRSITRIARHLAIGRPMGPQADIDMESTESMRRGEDGA